VVSNQHNKDIFEQLQDGEIIASNNPEAYKLREAAFATRKLLVQMNNSSDPAEIRKLLSQITGSEIDESVAVFAPLFINYGKHTKIGKNVFINFDCVFLDLGGITIEDNVLIAPKVSLLSEGHVISPNERHSLVPGDTPATQVEGRLGRHALEVERRLIGDRGRPCAGGHRGRARGARVEASGHVAPQSAQRDHPHQRRASVAQRASSRSGKAAPVRAFSAATTAGKSFAFGATPR